MGRVKNNPPRKRKPSTPTPPAQYRRRYERLKRRVVQLGYVCRGTITERWLRCGKPSCACATDPDQAHGPYYYWTRKVAGHTQTRLLPPESVALYREAIEKCHTLDRIIDQMIDLSLSAFQAARIQQKR